MNLICFPHYTCGGLLCDIMENTFSDIGSNGGIASFNHNIGKIGDSDTELTQYEVDLFYKKIHNCNANWVGTHCHPHLLDYSKFDKIIVVTTTTFKSKIYRWIRAYHHYFYNSIPWISVAGQDRIDKERETAKNYIGSFLPAYSGNITNIEFSEIVETSCEFYKLVEGLDVAKHIERWQSINHFLYDDIWNSIPIKRYHEAEYEVALNKSYLYE